MLIFYFIINNFYYSSNSTQIDKINMLLIYQCLVKHNLIKPIKLIINLPLWTFETIQVSPLSQKSTIIEIYSQRIPSPIILLSPRFGRIIIRSKIRFTTYLSTCSKGTYFKRSSDFFI